MRIRSHLLLGTTALLIAATGFASEPVDWKKRERDSSDTSRKYVHELRDDVKKRDWHFDVNHTTIVDHIDRHRINWYSDRWYVHIRNVEVVNELGIRLWKINNHVREVYIKEHPDVIPVFKHPGPGAPAFDWTKVLKDPEVHHPLSKESWVTASVEALEWNYQLRNGKTVFASVQPLIDHIPEKEAKAHASAGLALEFLLREGTAPESAYPSGKPKKEKHEGPLPIRAAAWGYVSDGKKPAPVETIKHALLQHGPLVASMNASRHFEAYSGGIYDENYQPKDAKGHGNHYVVIVGWDDNKGPKGSWRIRNCWGDAWGENGFAWVPFGTSNLGAETAWVEAASSHYKLPEEYYKVLGEAKPKK